jgi:hypothetical protein
VLPTSTLNAWSNGKYVTISSKMVAFAASDEELAFVMAHEMAHNMLAHNDATRPVSGLLEARLVKAKGSKARELEADSYGVRIMAAAGFNPISSLRLLERTRGRAPQGLALSHPGIMRRIAAIGGEIEQIMVELDSARIAEGRDVMVFASRAPTSPIQTFGLPPRFAEQVPQTMEISTIYRASKKLRIASELALAVDLQKPSNPLVQNLSVSDLATLSSSSRAGYRRMTFGDNLEAREIFYRVSIL